MSPDEVGFVIRTVTRPVFAVSVVVLNLSAPFGSAERFTTCPPPPDSPPPAALPDGAAVEGVEFDEDEELPQLESASARRAIGATMKRLRRTDDNGSLLFDREARAFANGGKPPP